MIAGHKSCKVGNFLALLAEEKGKGKKGKNLRGKAMQHTLL
jgi:hypothetical protein